MIVLADRYEIGARLGCGGSAEVFTARDRLLQRPVAVKLFRGAATADRARFEAEGVVLASLDHPGLVHVYDAGEEDGDAFVVLELIDGPTLATRLADGALSGQDVASIGIDVADALAYVHDHGVVHRDVTPANILVASDGHPRLTDFGIARLVDTTRITAAQTAVGTVAYMAPEQLEGRDVTPAADVYALGLVMLEMLTGRRAFGGAAHEVAAARLVRAPDTAGVPPAWRRLILAMTERSPLDRPSAREVRDRLILLRATADEGTSPIAVPGRGAGAPRSAWAQTAVDGTAVRPIALAPDAPPSPRRRRLVPPLVAALVLVVAALVAVRDDDGGVGSQPSTTTTDAPVTTLATTTTTTAVAPAEAAPDPSAKGGHGHGNGQGKGKDRGRRGG